MSIRNDDAHNLAQLERERRERGPVMNRIAEGGELSPFREPASSVAVAAAEKAAATARRQLERAQDYQMFVRQEMPRVFAAFVQGHIAYDGYCYNSSHCAERALRFTQDLWDALPEECKL